MQKPVRLADVGFVGGSAFHGVDEAVRVVGSDVRFHAKIPLLAFAGLVPFRVALAFGGGPRGDDGGVHERAFAQDEFFLREARVDFNQQAAREVVGLEQAAEF